MGLSTVWGLAAALLLAGAAPWAWSQDGSPLQLHASYAVQTDSNLFRLPAGANTQALTGHSSAAEQIGTTTLGAGLRTTQSLQHFEVDASLVDYQYQNFNYLSFTARNYAAAWRWALTPHFTGNFTSNRQETLNSFADYQGYGVRNQRTDSSTRLDGLYALEGPWGLQGGLVQTRQSNQQALLAGTDYSSTAADMGVVYALGSGSTVTYTAREARGNYLDRVLPSVGLYDDSFRQWDNGVRLLWVTAGRSTITTYLTHIQRTHPHYSQRDFSGLNTGIHLQWELSGKSALGASYSHELGTYATAYSSFTQTDRLELAPAWQIGPKTSLHLRHAWTQVDYLGSPAATVANARRDTTRDTTLALHWQPHPQWTVDASLQSQTRASNQAGWDFESTMATLSAHLSY